MQSDQHNSPFWHTHTHTQSTPGGNGPAWWHQFHSSMLTCGKSERVTVGAFISEDSTLATEDVNTDTHISTGALHGWKCVWTDEPCLYFCDLYLAAVLTAERYPAQDTNAIWTPATRRQDKVDEHQPDDRKKFSGTEVSPVCWCCWPWCAHNTDSLSVRHSRIQRELEYEELTRRGSSSTASTADVIPAVTAGPCRVRRQDIFVC